MAWPPQNWMGAYNEMLQTYQTESDRAAAIFGASFVDAMLGEVLRSYLVGDKGVAEMFDGDRPLATFSARIGVAHALGMLPPNIRNDLDKLRKIRNHFAHHPAATSFGDAPAKDHCASLSLVDPKSGVAMGPVQEMTRRGQFLMAVASLSIYFEQVTDNLRTGVVQRCAVPPTTRVYAE